MAGCKLCGKNTQLRNSHIVPEFLYHDLYNAQKQLMGITGVGSRGWKMLQKGIREHLFCEACEQHFNEYCEKPFRKQWIDTEPFPKNKIWPNGLVRWATFDYASFKLFHLSVIFRAGVSTLPTYAEVSLGPHEDTLRRMILNLDAGRPSVYPIFGYAVIHHVTRTLVPIVSQAGRSSFAGHRCYGLIYGGVNWWTSVSAHRNHGFERMGLQPDGRMPFHAVPWNEVSAIQSAAEALRRPMGRSPGRMR